MNPIQKQDRLEVVIISTGFNGISIARNEGIVIFVDGGIAGDKVLVEVYKVKKQHCEARIIEIKSYSDKRVKPQCQHFGVCGGCKWQHLQYESQLSEKQQQVIDAIERVGGFKNILVEPILPSSELYFYRNKLEFSFGTSRWKTNEELLANPIDEKEFILGFHAPQRWDKLVHIEECHLQSKQSNEILSFVRNFANQNNLTAYDSKTREGYLRNLVIREGKFTNETLVNLVTSNSNPELMKTLTNELLKSFPNITTVLNNINSRLSQVAIGEVEIIYHGDGFIHEKIDEQIYQISANSFFQTNSFQTVKLYNIVRMYAEIKESDIVYDLYCGTGTIALSIAPFVKKVIGVELEKSSITNANKNAELNNIQNCEFIQGDLKDQLKEIIISNPPDVIIVDPPRSGLHPKIIKELNNLAIKKIIYVSCNPQTLARDLRLLAEGGYVIEKIQPVDMFPHTFHIETVVKLNHNKVN